MMKVYGIVNSSCTERVLFALAEKGVSPALEVVDLTKGDHKKPPHVARQPFGVVPVLEDGDFRLYESRAIMQYVDAAIGPQTLTPSDAKKRAEMLQWISVEQSYFAPAGAAIGRNLLYARFVGHTPDMQAVEQAKLEIGRTLDVLERALEGRDYLVGEFSLADVTFTPSLELFCSLPQIASVVNDRPQVRRWIERTRQRAAWQSVLAFKRASAPLGG